MRTINELAAYQQSDLPARSEDLAKFMIVAQEKVKAVKAEIRAIQRLNLAKEVYAQKMEEQRRLQEVILLAYQRMGEITREIPKGSGGDRRSQDFKIPANGNFEKTKAQGVVTSTQVLLRTCAKKHRPKRRALKNDGGIK